MDIYIHIFLLFLFLKLFLSFYNISWKNVHPPYNAALPRCVKTQKSLGNRSTGPLHRYIIGWAVLGQPITSTHLLVVNTRGGPHSVRFFLLEMFRMFHVVTWQQISGLWIHSAAYLDTWNRRSNWCFLCEAAWGQDKKSSS